MDQKNSDFIFDCCSTDSFSNNSVNSDDSTSNTLTKDSDLLTDF